MARGTNADFDIFAGGAGVINGTASTGDRCFGIIRMQAGFHEKNGAGYYSQNLPNARKSSMRRLKKIENRIRERVGKPVLRGDKNH